MSRLLEELQKKFDVIIVDSPPILPVTDASVLTKSTDSVLLVVGTKRVSQHSLAKAIDQLNFVDANILGRCPKQDPPSGPRRQHGVRCRIRRRTSRSHPSRREPRRRFLPARPRSPRQVRECGNLKMTARFSGALPLVELVGGAASDDRLRWSP